MKISYGINWKLVVSNFKMVIRDKQALYFSLVFPIILMLVLKVVVGKQRINGMSYIDFVVPGLVTMTIVQLSIFAIAFVIAQQKEKGVLKRLLATPMTGGNFLAAQVFSRVVVSIIQVMLFVAMAILIMSYTMHGNFLYLIIVATLGSLVFLSLGFIVSGVSKSVETVPAIANLVVFPMIIFGDIFFSLSSVPKWLKPIVEHLPVKYLADGLRGVMSGGASLAAVKTDIFWLIGWLVVFAIIASRTFSFGSKK